MRIALSGFASHERRPWRFGRHAAQDAPASSSEQDRAGVTMPVVPRHFHWVWVGRQHISEEHLVHVLEIARLTPSFKEKSLWTNDRKLIDGTRLHTAARSAGEIDIAAALRRSGIRIRSIDALFDEPAVGFTRRELMQLKAIVYRDIQAPLAHHASASDVLRLLALHREGGIYADVDFSPHRNELVPGSPFEASGNDARQLRKTTCDALLSPMGPLRDAPQNRFGFSLLCRPTAIAEDALNNSVIASAAATEATHKHAIVAESLRLILRQEQRPQTLASAVKLRRQTNTRKYDRALARNNMTSQAHAERRTAMHALEVRPQVLAGKDKAAVLEYPTADEHLGLSWQAKRLSPRRQAIVDVVRSLSYGKRVPRHLLTESLTGSGVIRTAMRAHPEVRDASGKEMRMIALLTEMTPEHEFFAVMPPVDDPALRPLERARYARDA